MDILFRLSTRLEKPESHSLGRKELGLQFSGFGWGELGQSFGPDSPIWSELGHKVYSGTEACPIKHSPLMPFNWVRLFGWKPLCLVESFVAIQLTPYFFISQLVELKGGDVRSLKFETCNETRTTFYKRLHFCKIRDQIGSGKLISLVYTVQRLYGCIFL